VVDRVEWYRALAKIVLPGAPGDAQQPGRSQAPRFQGAEKLSRDMVVKLYKALIEYQAKPLCAYYGKMIQVVTFLKDATGLNDWKGWLEAVKTAQDAFLRDQPLSTTMSLKSSARSW
jgi:hypothetical protein